MTALSHIQSSLSDIARTGSLINQVPVMNDVDDTLRDIANFINTTVLPRCLQVTFSDQTRVRFGAHNRRLVQYSVSTNLDTQSHSNHALQPIVCASEDGAQIAQTLKSLCASKAILHKRIHEDPSMKAPMAPGVSAATILRFIDADGPSAGTKDLERRIF